MPWTDETAEPHHDPLPLLEAAPRARWSAEELGLAGAEGERLEAEDWGADLLEWFGPEAFEM
jgi:hypothetical protein